MPMPPSPSKNSLRFALASMQSITSGRGRAILPLSRASILPALAAALAVLAAVWWYPAAAAGAPTTVEPGQALATLLGPHTALAAPDARATRLQRVAVTRPLTGERTVLPVIGHRTDSQGAEWLHVLLPGRPNGHAGWIRRRATLASHTNWRVVVEIARRRVTAYRHGSPVRVFKAVVGKPTTPTPLGTFFVEEAIQLRADDVGAPFALALSARSTVLREYNGGPGQVAFHGLANVGGVPGTAVSHGCLRLDAGAMAWLVARITPGVPVSIRP